MAKEAYEALLKTENLPSQVKAATLQQLGKSPPHKAGYNDVHMKFSAGFGFMFYNVVKIIVSNAVLKCLNILECSGSKIFI